MASHLPTKKARGSNPVQLMVSSLKALVAPFEMLASGEAEREMLA